MPFQKGKSGNTTGRPKNTASPSAQLRQDQLEQVFDILLQAVLLDALRSPQLRYNFLCRLLPYVSKRKVSKTLPSELLTPEQIDAELDHINTQLTTPALDTTTDADQ